MSATVCGDRVFAVSTRKFMVVFTCKPAEWYVLVAVARTNYGTPENNIGWMSHGWRGARPTNLLDPWALPPVIASSSPVVGVFCRFG
ncbi:MAG: hypothetical protein IKZ87_08380 [Actinomycetaceae bacterium]|nr:hypothetical protein [Actinomycetaceae bacterium]